MRQRIENRESINGKPLHYDAINGITFKSERSDLRGGVEVRKSHTVSSVELCRAFAEFGAYHAMHIRPNLNGFSGYDCVRYEIKSR